MDKSLQYYKVPRTGDPSLTPQQFSELQVRILCARYWWLRAWEHQNLSFPYWRLYWNREDGGWIELEEVRYEVTPDCLFLIPPRTPFATGFVNRNLSTTEYPDHLVGGPATSEFLSSDSSGIRESDVIHHLFIHFLAGAPYDTMEHQVLVFPMGRVERTMLDEILELFDHEQDVFNRSATMTITALIVRLLSQIADDVLPKAPADPRIQLAIEQMEADISRSHTNEKLARNARMSPNAFARLFKEQTGMSPQNYLLSRRMQQACVMLHYSSDTIEEIAEACGFSNRYFFSRMFKKEMSISPAAFRKRQNV